MDTKDLIFEFVEGNTTPEQETVLFSEISTNPELQELLKHAVAVDSAINENQDYFSPSVETTNSVFATLGMDLPGSNIELSFTDKIGGFLSRNEGKLKNSLILLLLLSTTLLLINDFSNKNESPNLTSNTNLEGIPITTNIEVPKSDIYLKSNTINVNSKNNVISSESESLINNEISATKYEQHNSQKSSFTNRHDDNVVEESYKQQDIYSINRGYLATRNTLSIGNASSFNGSYSTIQTLDIIPEELQDKFSIEVRQTPSWATQSADIMPSELNTFNNTDIRLYYNLFSTLDVGIGVRQETFDQVFGGMSNDGREVTYYQKPNFTTFTANARYIYDSDLMLDPYMEASFGFNRGGIVSRAGTGFNISLFEDLNLMIGVEYSNLNYNFQNAVYNSSNFGINYGVRYKF